MLALASVLGQLVSAVGFVGGLLATLLSAAAKLVRAGNTVAVSALNAILLTLLLLLLLLSAVLIGTSHLLLAATVQTVLDAITDVLRNCRGSRLADGARHVAQDSAEHAASASSSHLLIVTTLLLVVATAHLLLVVSASSLLLVVSASSAHLLLVVSSSTLLLVKTSSLLLVEATATTKLTAVLVILRVLLWARAR